MKKTTRKFLSNFFIASTIAQIAFYSYVYIKKAKKKLK